MGFECGFVKVPRIHNISAEEYLYTKAMLSYEYFKTHYELCEDYDTFEKWFKANYRFFGKDLGCSYTQIAPDRLISYNEIEEEPIDFWCSIGRRLDDDYVVNKLIHIEPFEYYEVNKEWVENTLKEVNQSLAEEHLIPATILYSYTYNDDGDKVLKFCDGVFVEDEDGHQALIDSDYDNIWIAPKNFDTDYHYAKTSFKKTLEKLLTYDFKNDIIFYYRSY